MKKEMYCYILLLCGAGAGLFTFCLATSKTQKITYWTTSQTQREVQTKELFVVPLTEPNDVKWIWPEYFVKIKIKIKNKEITLKSEPFILTDNPQMEGKFDGRKVIFINQMRTN